MKKQQLRPQATNDKQLGNTDNTFRNRTEMPPRNRASPFNREPLYNYCTMAAAKPTPFQWCGTIEDMMVLSKDSTLTARFKQLSSVLRVEQRRLLEIAAENDGLPNNNILRKIAELEMNITAVENNLAELDMK